NQSIINILLNAILLANVLGFEYFGRDHDEKDQLMMQLPELDWFSRRGGTIFLFGPPGDPQYFKWEILFLALSIIIISPFLIFFTLDAMRNISKTNTKFLSGYTRAMARRLFITFIVQCLGAVVCYIVPLTFMLSFMLIDPHFVPGWLCACLRFLLV
ncbi:hypothetical protein PMAYCL1PPCAC_26178, partial [Pristionchus mayeri]